MSDAEAAKLIQSAYRGFEVRKWEPLKKLKQIAKVREQVDEVRNRIQALESTSDLNKDDRQRLLIGEMIMSLLLKLDTIQGLHPSVRDARKSLARELVTLQEKLDSLTSKQTEGKVKEITTAESADYPSVDGCRNASIERENENASAVCISSFEGTNENRNNIKEPYQENLAHMVDEKSDAKDEETTEPLIQHQDLDANMDNETIEVTADIECHTAQPVPIMELENEASNVKVQDMTRIQNGEVSPKLEHVSHLPSVPEQKSNADEFAEVKDLQREGKPEVLEVNDLIPVNNNTEEDKLRSLPKEMTDSMHAVCGLEKQIGNSNGEKESDPDLPAEVVNLRGTNKDQKIDLLEDLPLGIIDEEPAISEFEKCELHETGESNMLSSTEGHLAGCQADKPLLEAASNNCVKGQKESELTKNPELLEQTLEEEANSDDKFESVVKQEEVPWTGGEENNDKVHHEEDDFGEIPVDHMASSESGAGSVATQEKEVLFEEKKEEANQPVGTEEKEEMKLENDIEVQEPEYVNSKDKATDMPCETVEERVLVGTYALSEPNGEIAVDHMASSESEAGSVATQEKEVLFEEEKEEVNQPVGTEEKEAMKLVSDIEVQEPEYENSKDNGTDMPRETVEEKVLVRTDALSKPNVEQELPVSPAASQMSDDEHGLAETRGDNKLIEENKKLREMMEKLMEAGKDQLTAISNLTGRVKDLEEKLSRNKKLSKPRHRKAVYAPSYCRPVRPRGRAADVAV